jgi:hypothetical protein
VALIAAGLLLAGPALAGSKQMGMIVEKNLTTKRLTLHTGVVLQVSGATRIVSSRGMRITLANLETADASDGVVVANPQALVQYEGRIRGGIVDATMVRVVGVLPR